MQRAATVKSRVGWAGSRDQGLWRISVGVGLKLRIPVQILSAPLEFYYGVPIQRDRDDERESFSLSFSTRF